MLGGGRFVLGIRASSGGRAETRVNYGLIQTPGIDTPDFSALQSHPPDIGNIGRGLGSGCRGWLGDTEVH